MAADALVRAIRGVDKQVITAVRVFDRYRPDGGELSLALEVVLQPGEERDYRLDITLHQDAAAVMAASSRLRQEDA